MKKIILTILIISIIALYGCTEQTTEPTDSGSAEVDVIPQPAPVVLPPADVDPAPVVLPPTDVEPASATLPPAATQSIKEITVTAKQWEFTPNPIVVSEGDRVILTIKSIDVQHGFKLPDFGVDVKFDAGEEVTAEFIADKTGTFTFFCNVPCGSGHSSMQGSLVVE